ncbi:MAG: hypothetical protein OEU26_01195 [Candidatus Tectomicrobia bacterium]|nr:hypothetical protein [Candidatus Tectomicrobia bacterium]
MGEPDAHASFTGRGSNWKGSTQPRAGVQDEQAANRVQDMDDEGADVHILIPSSWTSVVGLDDPTLEVGLLRAYHRHMANFCGPFPERLKGLIIASTRDVDDAVRQIRQWGASKWAVAVMPILSIGTDRPAEVGADLASGARARPAGGAPQFHMESAVFSGLPRCVE